MAWDNGERGVKAMCVVVCGMVASMLAVVPALAEPDHPVITEVYTDPPGANDGPVNRDAANPHQEYIEIYLPTAAGLAAGLNKDALNLTIYEVEGDTSSSGYTLVNYRIDLPTFDLDAGNGLTSGAVARPSSGVVVIGWVDYEGDPPTDLLGTPSTRVALVNDGVTATTDYVFVAMNGAQFSGTTNFPVPFDLSLIHMPDEASSGIIQNGSGAYLLVNRDDPGYVELYDDKDEAHVPPIENADPALADGTVLQLSALLDAVAGNDDDDFDVLLQPFDAGDPVDLADVLPAGGAFTPFVPQIAEDGGHGYLRLLVDAVKTTEDGLAGNEDPLSDALNHYRTVSNLGPWFPSPGRATFSTSPPELSVADAVFHQYSVLGGTTGPLPLVAANVGGGFAMEVTATPGSSSNPTAATFAAGDPVVVDTAQTGVSPFVRATVPLSAIDGAVASVPVTVEGTNVNAGDPALVNPIWETSATATVLNPTTGLDADNQPFQTTVFVAIQGVVFDPGVANEFRTTGTGAFLTSRSDITLYETFGFGSFVLDSATDVSDPGTIKPLVEEFPEPGEECTNWLNPAGPVGRLSFADTVTSSAEVFSGADSYVGSIDVCSNTGETVIRAISLNVPDTFTSGGPFTTGETLHFVDADGDVGGPDSSLTNVTTARTFEVAIFDSTVNFDGSFETGATDDFGIIIEVEETETGAPVVDGEFVFLSFTGGLQGADIDTLEVPPGNMVGTIILLDLDNLQDVLGVRSIEAVYLIDGSGSGEADVVEAFSLHPVAVAGCTIDADCDDANPCTDDSCDAQGLCQHTDTVGPCDDDNACTINDACSGGVCTGDPLDCDDGLFCTGAEFCDPQSGCVSPGNPCPDPGDCDETGDNCGCVAPTVTVGGPRYLDVTPADLPGNVALWVTGVDADVACVAGYVQASGLVGPNPVYRPASGTDGWNTVHVHGERLISSRTYAVQADCDANSPGTSLSPAAEGTTWAWADADNNTVVDITDIVKILDVFTGRFHTLACETDQDCTSPTPVPPFFTCDQVVGKCLWVTLENTDLIGATSCRPDRSVSVRDVVVALDEFQGKPVPCTVSCP